jgi:hypothetical protein
MGGTNFSYENSFNYFNDIDGKIDSAPGTIKINDLSACLQHVLTLFCVGVDSFLQPLFLSPVSLRFERRFCA